MRGEKVAYVAPAKIFEVEKPAAAVVTPGVAGVSKQFEFATALPTIEEFEPLADKVKERAGILAVSGSERTITVTWDSARLDEAAVRRLLAELGRPVR
jgi:maltose-binding protein MalE